MNVHGKIKSLEWLNYTKSIFIAVPNNCMMIYKIEQIGTHYSAYRNPDINDDVEVVITDASLSAAKLRCQQHWENLIAGAIEQ